MISAHFCGFCAVFAIGFCLVFQHCMMLVETVFSFCEIHRFLVLAFCFVNPGYLKLFEVLQDNLVFVWRVFLIVFCSTIFLCKVRNERKKKRKKKKKRTKRKRNKKRNKERKEIHNIFFLRVRK